MSEMSVKESLLITRDYYKWLEKNPKAIKADWPGWEKLGISFDVFTKNKTKDPLCQVAQKDCKKCPMISHWMKDAGSLKGAEKFTSCLVKTSPVMLLLNTLDPKMTKEKRAEIAREVWEAAELYLEKDVPVYGLPKATRVTRDRKDRVRRVKVLEVKTNRRVRR